MSAISQTVEQLRQLSREQIIDAQGIAAVRFTEAEFAVFSAAVRFVERERKLLSILNREGR